MPYLYEIVYLPIRIIYTIPETGFKLFRVALQETIHTVLYQIPTYCIHVENEAEKKN